MAEHDPLVDLPDLARVGEEYAEPMPAERVRRLGQRRRTRRRLGVVAAAVAAVVVAGGTAWSSSLFRTDQLPNPVATPAPTVTVIPPSPSVRRLTMANLITLGEVPNNTGGDRIDVSDPGSGRSVETASACVPGGGWDSLGATQVLSRNFRIVYQPPGFDPDPDFPTFGEPQIYTVALQFADETRARAALATYRGWLADCASELERRGYPYIGGGGETRFVSVRSGTTAIGEYAAVPTYRPAGFTTSQEYEEFAFWEHVGLTRVDDRLMVTVEVIFGNEHHDSDLPGGDPDTGLPANIQFSLIKAAAKRLTG